MMNSDSRNTLINVIVYKMRSLKFVSVDEFKVIWLNENLLKLIYFFSQVEI